MTVYGKLRANTILSGENLFSLKGENLFLDNQEERRIPTLTTFIQHILEVLASPVRQEKKIEGIRTGKEEIKLSLFVDGMILYIENPKDTSPDQKKKKQKTTFRTSKLIQ